MYYYYSLLGTYLLTLHPVAGNVHTYVLNYNPERLDSISWSFPLTPSESWLRQTTQPTRESNIFFVLSPSVNNLSAGPSTGKKFRHHLGPWQEQPIAALWKPYTNQNIIFVRTYGYKYNNTNFSYFVQTFMLQTFRTQKNVLQLLVSGVFP
jgi:hypothetical protein